jgi:formamidopyrimidine-DNA glycosylase
MPELPDIEAYIEALRPRVVGETLLGIRLANPFLVRTVDPPLEAVVGGRVEALERLGKRVVFEVTIPSDRAHPPERAASSGQAAASAPDPLPVAPIFIVVHLMVAGRLHWKGLGSPIPRGSGLASLHLVRGRGELARLDPGGLEIVGSTLEAFGAVLRRENRTLKRALADPRTLSGVGNAYSDEILHKARLSPLKQTKDLNEKELAALHAAATEVLEGWTERLRAEARETFPEKVTAFRPGMAVHGRFGLACPQCGAAVQRIVYADNECDYCPSCQTNGRILADRALSRLLKDDWPRKVPPDSGEKLR